MRVVWVWVEWHSVLPLGPQSQSPVPESLAGVGLRQRSVGPGFGLVWLVWSGWPGLVGLVWLGWVWQFCPSWIQLPEMHKHGTSHQHDGEFRILESWTNSNSQNRQRSMEQGRLNCTSPCFFFARGGAACSRQRHANVKANVHVNVNAPLAAVLETRPGPVRPSEGGIDEPRSGLKWSVERSEGARG